MFVCQALGMKKKSGMLWMCFNQATQTLLDTDIKLSLLRMSLDLRLSELPSDAGLDKLDIVRQELEALHVNTGSRNYLTVAKMAALTGKLNVRYVWLVAMFLMHQIAVHFTYTSLSLVCCSEFLFFYI